jgi:hypothetical protein
MRHSQAAIGLICLALAGCFTGQGEYTAVALEHPEPFAAPSGPDMTHLDVAVVERPWGDDFLNRGLWELADEQVVTRERPELSTNGLRISQMGGSAPAGLLALLTSPRSNPRPRGVEVHAGDPVPVPLGDTCPECRFRLYQEEVVTEVKLENARCFLVLEATPADDGKVRVRFTPTVRHGKTELRFAPHLDPSGARTWERQEDQPEEIYERLSWDVTASPGELIVVGMRADRMGTLGQASFLPPSDGPRIQRLLVVRTSRPQTASALDESSIDKAPPLALRAGLESVRGSGE